MPGLLSFDQLCQRCGYAATARARCCGGRGRHNCLERRCGLPRSEGGLSPGFLERPVTFIKRPTSAAFVWMDLMSWTQKTHLPLAPAA